VLKEILDITPADEVGQLSSQRLLPRIAARLPATGVRVLDLGCGDGRSFDWFERSFTRCSWTGLDIEDSPEVRSRRRQDCVFESYNGVDIPFADQSFDVVFSNQVFEHVRHPERLLGEVRRVLSPGGLFVGSVSYLEPYHSYSLFNFTPYGWYVINRASGLVPELMAAGIDSLSLIRRSIDRQEEDRSWWTLSPLNQQILADPALSIQEKNYKMLMYAGHIVFVSRKP
jgi:ubiquinone/menaquinone biosynthesis C-methylase UbiE